MTFISVKEASAKTGLTEDKIRIMCRDGKLKGAEKRGNIWFIPEEALENFNSEDTDEAQKLPDSSAEAEPMTAVNSVTAPTPNNDKGMLISFVVLFLLFVAFFAGAVACGVVFIDDGSTLLAMFGLLLGFCAYGLAKALGKQSKDISSTILEQKKARGKSSLKKEIYKAVAVSVAAVIIIAVGGLSIYGLYDASYLNRRADELLEETVDKNIFNEIADFENYYNNQSPLAHLFFGRKTEIKELNDAASKIVLERAEEISAGIKNLKPVTKIKSEEQYNQLYSEITSLRLSEDDPFEKKVREQVENYDDLVSYDEAFTALCKTYLVTASCSSCRGRGSFSCSSCSGRGKKVVTWYEYGDWGEKSYSSYTCTSCNGRGKSSCGRCGGDGKHTYYSFENN